MFVGHTRFSLFSPSSTGWKASNGTRFRTADEYRRYLFSDERMGPRMEIFTSLSLPQLDAASRGFQVSHVVSYPAVLPGKYRRQLQEAASAYPFIVLDEHGPSGSRLSPRQLAADRYRASGEPFARYRLDDDDLLPVDYFAQVAPYVRPENAGFMVSLGAGAMALYADRQYFNIRRCHVPMIAIGLLSICRYAEDGTLLEPVAAPHNQSDRSNPVILDSRRPGYLWTRHVAQDSSLGFGTPDMEGLTDLLLSYMDKHPAATPADGIEAAFPAAAAVFSGRERPGARRVQEMTTPTSVGDDPTPVPLEPVSGAFALTVDVASRRAIGKNHLLLSFTIEDGAGRRLDPATERDWLRGTGLNVSNNPAIGYFCYVKVRAGTYRVVTRIQLPTGKILSELFVRRFGSKTVDLALHRLAIEEQS